MESAPPCEPAPRERRLALALFGAGLLFSLWGLHVGWASKRLPGFEFRQAQTALSAYWIMEEHDFSLAYPTPVLGKPWSVPMEFPLYQWTVVGVSEATGLSLTKSGRAVSIACFYLCLPAIFLLLRRWSVPVGRRWLVLAVIVTCPFYLFYGRAFLIETMALMFSLWFWVAFERAVAGRSVPWLLLAMVAGTGAGLVKVTTFAVYLLPAAWWAGCRLWTGRNEKREWRREVAWMAAAVALPFAATLAWLHFADATKALNPLGRFLTAASLRSFNLGTIDAHLSLKYWAMKGRITTGELSWWPVLTLCALAAVVAGRARWRELAGCLAWFTAALVLFPILYALHDYYYVANAMLLLLAMGLALVALAETRVPRGVVCAVALLVVAGQGFRYRGHYYPEQSQVLPAGDGLTDALQTITAPNEVIVVLGQDWNSMLPYFARRRALMIREDEARTPGAIAAGLAGLAGEKIGAALIEGDPFGRADLVRQLAALGMTAEPVFIRGNIALYLPAERRDRLVHVVLDYAFGDVKLAPGVSLPREGLSNQWRTLASLRIWERRNFTAMNPQPVRYFSNFGPNSDASSGRLLYNAHPDTRLVFALSAGAHTLRTTLEMPADAWRVEEQHTDGVEVILWALGPGETRREIATRYFNPYAKADERVPGCPFVVEFSLPVAGEVELDFGPGPVPDYTRDWIMLGPLTIE